MVNVTEDLKTEDYPSELTLVIVRFYDLECFRWDDLRIETV